LFTVPEYILSISRDKPGSQEMTPAAWSTFHRDDLLPYQQDIYDSEGNLETQVTYFAYQDFEGANTLPSVTIKRPLEEIRSSSRLKTFKRISPLPTIVRAEDSPKERRW
jgi:hypothetical protein